jgi:ATP-dependent DNA ligase
MAKRVRTGGLSAEKSEMPGFIKPQLATLRARAPKGDQWLHEIKFDGYRVQIHLNKGKRKVFTRTGLDWTKRFSVIDGAFDIPGQAIIDGEVVVVHDGRTNFSELQAELAAGNQDRLVAFDLLWRVGVSQAASRACFFRHQPANEDTCGYPQGDTALIGWLHPIRNRDGS